MAEYDTALVALIDKDLNATKDAGGINEPIMSIAGANGEVKTETHSSFCIGGGN